MDAPQVLAEDEQTPSRCAASIVDDSTTLAIDLTGILEPEKEIQKLQSKQVSVSWVFWPSQAHWAVSSCGRTAAKSCCVQQFFRALSI